jgi:exonuclease V gamma subunit
MLDNGLRATPEPMHILLPRLQATGQLAPGTLGRSTFNAHHDRIAQALAELGSLRMPTKMWRIDLALPHAIISAELIQNYSCGLLHIRANKPMDAKQHIRSGLIALLVCASELPVRCFDYEKNALKPRQMKINAQQAREALQQLSDLMTIGNTQLLCFEAKISYAFYLAKRKQADLDVLEWLHESMVKEADEFMSSFDDNLDFLTHGQGFISAIALKNPAQFETLALLVFSALMGEAIDG